MSFSFVGIATGALQNAQIGLQTTGNNISNATTPGYSRQSLNQSEAPSGFTGGGWVGNGAEIQGIQRMSSHFLSSQVNTATSSAAEADTLQSSLEPLNNLMGSFDTGFSAAASNFYASASSLSSNPDNSTFRDNFINASSSLVSRMNEMGSQLQTSADQANKDLRQSVSTVNTLAQSLANLNAQAPAGDASNAPPDLQDKREQLLEQISRQIGVQVVNGQDGSLNVYIGNGHPLVLGAKSFNLTTYNSTSDPSNLNVGYTVAGQPTDLGPENMGGGAIGGLLKFKQNTLQPAQNELGRVGAALADAVNKQNQLGARPDGTQGGNIFNIPAPQSFSTTGNAGSMVMSASFSNTSQLTGADYSLKFDGTNWTVTNLSNKATSTFASLPATVDGVKFQAASGAAAAGDSFLVQPTRGVSSNISLAATAGSMIATAIPVSAQAANGNTGSATVTDVSVSSNPWNAALTTPATVSYVSGNNFTVNGSPVTATASANGLVISSNGWSMILEGAPKAGDSFTVAPSSGTGDGRNANNISNISKLSLVGGQLTATGAYSALVSTIGGATQTAQSTARSSKSILDNATTKKDALSGVNLDEEATNMLKYQQAYQAAAKLLGIAGQMFTTIINI